VPVTGAQKARSTHRCTTRLAAAAAADNNQTHESALAHPIHALCFSGHALHQRGTTPTNRQSITDEHCRDTIGCMGECEEAMLLARVNSVQALSLLCSAPGQPTDTTLCWWSDSTANTTSRKLTELAAAAAAVDALKFTTTLLSRQLLGSSAWVHVTISNCSAALADGHMGPCRGIRHLAEQKDCCEQQKVLCLHMQTASLGGQSGGRGQQVLGLEVRMHASVLPQTSTMQCSAGVCAN
jgi:hypothetical protein